MRRRLALVAVLAVVGLLALAAPAGAVHDTGSQFVVQLSADGDATVFLEDRYDLSAEGEREAFAAVRGNESRQAAMADRFTARLRDAAERAEAATGRSMTVEGATVNVTATDEVGIVRVESRWRGLAAVDREDGYVQVSEPFATGFEVDRPLAVHGPPGFTRASTHPEPGRALKNAAFWAGDRDLDGFRARFTGPVSTPSGTPTATVAPVTVGGLTAFANAAALALVPVLLLVVVFRREPR